MKEEGLGESEDVHFMGNYEQARPAFPLKEKRGRAEHPREQVGSTQFEVGVDFQPERFVLQSLISRSEERVTFLIAFWFGLSQFL